MITPLYIMLFCIAIVFQIVGLLKKNIWCISISLMFWILLFGQSVWIETEYALMNGTNVTTGTVGYTELGVQFLILGFLILDIILLIMWFMYNHEQGKMPWWKRDDF